VVLNKYTLREKDRTGTSRAGVVEKMAALFLREAVVEGAPVLTFM
jgi:hypothetical protein